ncbi:MAG: hypothetical protein ACETWM_22720 [Candidatus Lokiarchaeia archaeon]
MSKTISLREKSTLIVEFDTWRTLNKLKKELGLKSLDEVIQYLISEDNSKYERWRNFNP